jgi:MFS family permease
MKNAEEEVKMEEKIKKAKEKNVKLYPIYKMFSWDLLFYYSIIYLFLNQTKNLKSTEIFFGNAFYPIFKIAFQPFSPILINKLGKIKSTILGNILVSISIAYVMTLKGSMINLIVANLFMAIGYIFKGVCEASILDEGIIDDEKRNSIFSKIDGRSSAYWYILEAISAVFTGFLFVINSYIPMILCLIICIIGTIISTRFKEYEIKSDKKSKKRITLKQRIALNSEEYRFILKSGRLRCLFLFSIVFFGLLYIRSTLTSSILLEIGISDKYFGIITGILTIFAAITTLNQNTFHKKFHNKLLTVCSITYSFSLIILGGIINLSINKIVTLIIVFTMMIIQNMIKGPYYTLMKRYLNSFSNERISVKIYAINTFVEDIGSTLISFFTSYLLTYTNSANTVLIIGVSSLVVFIVVLYYMKNRIGLKKEEYNSQDISFEASVLKRVKKNKIKVEVNEHEAKIVKNSIEKMSEMKGKNK